MNDIGWKEKISLFAKNRRGELFYPYTRPKELRRFPFFPLSIRICLCSKNFFCNSDNSLFISQLGNVHICMIFGFLTPLPPSCQHISATGSPLACWHKILAPPRLISRNLNLSIENTFLEIHFLLRIQFPHKPHQPPPPHHHYHRRRHCKEKMKTPFHKKSIFSWKFKRSWFSFFCVGWHNKLP